MMRRSTTTRRSSARCLPHSRWRSTETGSPSTVHAQASDARQLPRGPVTFLYADVEGSTLLLDRLGERYADVLAEERRLLRAIVHEHGGFEIDSRADQFFAAFPEAADPVGAALKIQRRLRDHAWPDGAAVRVRIGLHSGQPQMTDEGYVGLDVHRASRIGSAGHGGQILAIGGHASADRTASAPRCDGAAAWSIQLEGSARPGADLAAHRARSTECISAHFASRRH